MNTDSTIEFGSDPVLPAKEPGTPNKLLKYGSTSCRNYYCHRFSFFILSLYTAIPIRVAYNISLRYIVRFVSCSSSLYNSREPFILCTPFGLDTLCLLYIVYLSVNMIFFSTLIFCIFRKITQTTIKSLKSVTGSVTGHSHKEGKVKSRGSQKSLGIDLITYPEVYPFIRARYTFRLQWQTVHTYFFFGNPCA